MQIQEIKQDIKMNRDKVLRKSVKNNINNQLNPLPNSVSYWEQW